MMKLDRNVNADGRGKYGLILNRRIKEIIAEHGIGGLAPVAVRDALRTLESFGVIDWGDKVDTEFFVIRLKDENAHAALMSYAVVADIRPDHEYAREVYDLALRAGPYHPNCKKPD